MRRLLGAILCILATSATAAWAAANQSQTAAPGPSLHMSISLSEHFTRTATRFLSATLGGTVEPHLRVHLACSGQDCPFIGDPSIPVSAAHPQFTALNGKVFRAGDHLVVTISAPHFSSELSRVTFRSGLDPLVTPFAPGLNVLVNLTWRARPSATRLLGLTPGVHTPLPAGGTITFSCRGAGCPRMPGTLPAARDSLEALNGYTFDTGDTLTVEIAAPKHTPERVSIAFNGAKPKMTLLLP